jgi:hypothetical protein
VTRRAPRATLSARERLTRAALLAYPDDVRAAIGAEMTATLLDASAGSRTRFVRELADLARLGLRSRAHRTAAAGPRRVIADGLCLAGVWLMTLDLSTLLAQTVRGMHDPLLAPPSLILLGVALALALAGHDRLAGATALAWTAARLPALLGDRPGATLEVIAATLPSVTCFAVMALAPRRRTPEVRGLAWLIVPATLVLTFGPPPYDQPPLLVALVAITALLVVVYALAMLTTDPRIAIAGAVPLSTIGIGTGSFLVMGLAAPLVLVVAAVRIRQLAAASIARR